MSNKSHLIIKVKDKLEECVKDVVLELKIKLIIVELVMYVYKVMIIIVLGPQSVLVRVI